MEVGTDKDESRKTTYCREIFYMCNISVNVKKFMQAKISFSSSKEDTGKRDLYMSKERKKRPKNVKNC